VAEGDGVGDWDGLGERLGRGVRDGLGDGLADRAGLETDGVGLGAEGGL
jgi:hypothetical protein